MAFEEAFEVRFPSEDLEQIQTVGDVVKYSGSTQIEGRILA